LWRIASPPTSMKIENKIELNALLARASIEINAYFGMIN
jgi:hypothetical protein